MWRLGGFNLILDAEYGFWKEIRAVYGFSIAVRLKKILNVKRLVINFRLLCRTFLVTLGNCLDLSDLPIAVKYGQPNL